MFKTISSFLTVAAVAALSFATPASAWVWEQPNAQIDVVGFTGSANDSDGTLDGTITVGVVTTEVISDTDPNLALGSGSLDQSTGQHNFELDGTLNSQDVSNGAIELDVQVGYMGVAVKTATEGVNDVAINATGDFTLAGSESSIDSGQDVFGVDFGHHQGGSANAKIHNSVVAGGIAVDDNQSTVSISVESENSASD